LRQGSHSGERQGETEQASYIHDVFFGKSTSEPPALKDGRG